MNVVVSLAIEKTCLLKLSSKNPDVVERFPQKGKQIYSLYQFLPGHNFFSTVLSEKQSISHSEKLLGYEEDKHTCRQNKE